MVKNDQLTKSCMGFKVVNWNLTFDDPFMSNWLDIISITKNNLR